MEEPVVAGAAQHLQLLDPSHYDSGEQGGNGFNHSNTNDAIDKLSATRPRPERRSIVPPYWQRQDDSNCNTVNKNASAESLSRTSPIRLEDHTDEGSEQCKALWAKRVTIDDYVIVSGSAPAVGSYVVWNCTVETLDGGPMKMMKRYSEFDELRRKLVKTFPHAQGAIPPLPPKSVISRFRPRFLDRRHAGLSYFLNCILLNPEFAGSPVLKDFLFS